jgi:hypothetical protein
MRTKVEFKNKNIRNYLNSFQRNGKHIKNTNKNKN